MIFNLGSINADFIYSVPHLPGSGETLAATQLVSGLGGKGANQSVATVLAGAQVCHIGAVGPDGAWAVKQLADFGVDTTNISTVDMPTAHAIINVDPAGENAIVIFPGANYAQKPDVIKTALASGGAGDWLMLQNETSHQVEAAKTARYRGMNIAYSAAPFNKDAVKTMLPYARLLIMNAIEAEQLTTSLKTQLPDLPTPNILITKGSDGADWIDTSSGETVSVSAFPVTPVDTTGAGDTFAGYTIADLAKGMTPKRALIRAAAAAAISVTRKGTADSIPTSAEVDAFLN